MQPGELIGRPVKALPLSIFISEKHGMKPTGGRMSKAEIYRDKSGEYRWRVFADNGEQIAQGEGYTTHTDAERGLETALAEMAELHDAPPEPTN